MLSDRTVDRTYVNSGDWINLVEDQRDAEDLRVQRTKYVLREALAKLLEQNECGLDGIPKAHYRV